jgi:hypothetical protein
MPPTETEILNDIKEQAIKLWGEKWLTELTRQYNHLFNAEGDTNEAYRNKRSQIQRSFDGGGITLKNVMRLAECVGVTIRIKR